MCFQDMQYCSQEAQIFSDKERQAANIFEEAVSMQNQTYQTQHQCTISVYIYTYIHIYTYTHTHIYTYIYYWILMDSHRDRCHLP